MLPQRGEAAVRRLRAVAATVPPDAQPAAVSAAFAETVLVANRGESACRVIRALREVGVRSVAVAAEDDAQGLHVKLADDAAALTGKGPAAYLDAEQMVKVAKRCGANSVHPGWGFLSEDPHFADLVQRAGMTFIGPSPAALRCFGDKTKARALAADCGIPCLPGTAGATLGECSAFLQAQGGAGIMLKAAEGGGGRGMRPVHTAAELPAAFAACEREAAAAFGKPRLFCERLLRRPRHVEVQCVADGSSCATLWERDCSLQRSRQKVIEIAPCIGISAGLRKRLSTHAKRLVSAAEYRGVATVEFLVEGGLGDGAREYFMEVNPRLQVEHTITEEISGVDLVHAQLRLAGGASLASLRLPDDSAAPSKCSLQCRVNMERTSADGTVTPLASKVEAYLPACGRGVRVDSCGYAGWSPSPRYDSLIGKLICTADTFPAAVGKARSALLEFHVGGPPTNLARLAATLSLPAFGANELSTEFLSDHAAAIAAQVDSARPRGMPGGGGSGTKPAQSPRDEIPAGGVAAQLAGEVVEVRVTVGQGVREGDAICVVSAMKMESVIEASATGTVKELCVAEGDDIGVGQLVAVIDETAPPDASAAAAKSANNWQPEMDELAERRQLAKAGDAERRAAHKKQGKMTVHERIDTVLDAESFREIGGLAARFRYDKQTGKMVGLSAASNVIIGRGKIGGRTVVINGDDFTVRGGSAEGSIGDKRGYAERLARELRVPVVRLIDGNSGGGSVGLYSSDSGLKGGTGKAPKPAEFDASKGSTYMPTLPAYYHQVKMLGEVPVASVLLGPVVGIGAARAVASHFSVIVRGMAQLMVAGPPVVKHATRENLTKEELGGADVVGSNGSVDNVAESEADAYAQVQLFLSYMPSSAWDLPQRAPCSDPPTRRDPGLRELIPRNRRRHFDVRRAITGICDEGSFFEVGAGWARNIVTGFARLNGWPVGVISSDSRFRGGGMDVSGSQKLRRHTDLCECFHLPLLNLVDMPGFEVGSESERAGVIRHGMALGAAMYLHKGPRLTVVMRRAFGVAAQVLVNSDESRDAAVSQRFAWPMADWGSLPLEGGVEAAFGRQLRAQPDGGKRMREKIMSDMEKIRSPFRTADYFGVEDIIDPASTREAACEWVELAYRKLAHGDLLGPGFYRP